MSKFRFAILGIAFLAPAAFAQTAQITGRITDSSGAVVPGAMVKVTAVATGAGRDVPANGEGYYTVPLLLPGDYTVSVEMEGFRRITRSGISLSVDQRAELNFSLEVGSVSEKMVVLADAAQLDTVQGSQGQVIDNKRIVELPLNGRNYEELALMSAGAVQPLPMLAWPDSVAAACATARTTSFSMAWTTTPPSWPRRNAGRKWCNLPSTSSRSSKFKPTLTPPSTGGQWARS